VSYTVGQLAALAHVTVRALHHYDAIGLLTPSARTAAGYRRYNERDLERLQQLLFYRELGFPLDQIAALLDGDTEPQAHLRTQRQLLTERIARLEAMVSAIDRTMEANGMGFKLKPEERFEVFGDFVPEDHEAESRSRWGSSPAFAASQRRVAEYSKDDWLRLRKEAEDITDAMSASMRAGVPSDSVQAMDLAERHRQHITRWFYDCSYAVHRGLGEMYVADPRFTIHYDTVVPGLAAFVRDAILANARRAGA
jgi:MerR family transcriptional regulator, thiopeptide resistance regulator